MHSVNSVIDQTHNDQSVSDARATVSAILKKVDQLIRAGDIDESIRQVIRAREIDPKHVYIHAYEERLAYLKEQHQKNLAEEQTRKSAEEAARRRAEELQMRHDEERARLAELQRDNSRLLGTLVESGWQEGSGRYINWKKRSRNYLSN